MSAIKGYATTAALVLAIALVLAWGGPAIDDNSAEFARADSLADAIKAEQAQARFERAAQAMCGQNAAWRLTNNTNEVQCLTKNGRKTVVAQVAP